ncbi:hypothetical protein Nmel_007574 [Mimus melanotis]
MGLSRQRNPWTSGPSWTISWTGC